REVAQDVVQNAAVLEVLDLLGSIDAAGQGDLLRSAVAAMDGHRDVHARPQAALDAAHVEALVAGEVQRLAGHAVLELQLSTPMPTRFERWMRSKVSHTTA